MKGWRGSPARHALAARGVSTRNVDRPASISARPQGGPVSLGEVFDRITETAFAEAASSPEALVLLGDRNWLKSRIHQESATLQLSIGETAELENEILPLFDEERSVVAGLVQVVDQMRPKGVPE